jgi:urease accessory protein
MDLLKRCFSAADRRALAAVAALLAAPELHAHGIVDGSNAFLSGLVHPVTALEHVLPLLALGMLAGQRGLRAAEGLVVAFPLAFACGAFGAALLPGIPDLSVVNAATAVVIGALVALAFGLSRPFLYAVVVITGALHGLANGGAIVGALPTFIAGATLSATLLFVYAFGVVDHVLRRQKPWLPVAVRAIGSWIAAFGILTVALAFSTAPSIA